MTCHFLRRPLPSLTAFPPLQDYKKGLFQSKKSFEKALEESNAKKAQFFYENLKEIVEASAALLARPIKQRIELLLNIYKVEYAIRIVLFERF